MEALTHLFAGFAVALQPAHLAFAFTGCVLGMLVGVIPGVGPAAGTAILIPMTVTLDPTSAVIMLAAIYYGAMYGGTITSILLNLPGEAASAVTCLDGYEMARKGRAGPALAIAAIGSFVGGTIATLGLVLLAIPLSRLALSFGPPEFFSLMMIGLCLVIALASRSLVLALISAVLGMLLSQVGIDPVMGAPRFTFDEMELLDGIGVVPLVMGLFGIGEILTSLDQRERQIFAAPARSLVLSRQDLRESIGPIARGTGIGFFLGLIPGVGAIVPTYLSYAIEKNVSKTPAAFGTGVIAGVAGPETANNAYANAAFVPLFTLGIPGAATTAILMGALMMNGLVPGPALFIEKPQFIWAVIASFFVGNAMLLVLSLPFVPLWVRVLRIPHAYLVAIVLVMCIVGAYSMRGSLFDVGLMIGFGVAGYLCRKVDLPLAPMILTFVLAPLMERSLRQSLEMSQGHAGILLSRPLSLALLVLAAAVLVASTFSAVRSVRGADGEV
ncbi:MAG: tripartite tricarboxylate transporter permease [Lautropia sp.]